MSLLARQRALRDHILAAEPDGVEGVAPGAARGLAVYRHAYRAQLAACLRETFEKTHAWLGDEAFNTACEAHIVAHPPHSWTLDDYGDGFDQTLRELYPNDPEVGELAWLDWTLSRAFSGPDADTVSAEALAAVDWDRAVLRLAPTLAVAEARSNAAAIWSAMAEDGTPPAATVLPRPAAVRVWRIGLSPQFRTIEDLERRALELARDGVSFADLCDQLADQNDSGHVAQVLGAMLGGWLRDGLIVAVD